MSESKQKSLRLKVGDQLESGHLAVLIEALLMLREQSRAQMRPGFECSGPICICSGDGDCNDMFSGGHCGDAVCFENDGNVVCLCIRAKR